MFILTLPSGLATVFAAWWLSVVYGGLTEGYYGPDIILDTGAVLAWWIPFYVTGYIQWAIVVAAIIDWFRQKRGPDGPSKRLGVIR